MKQIPGGVTAPKGFRAWGVHCGVKSKKADKKDLALILSDQECAAAAVYTMNRVKAAPLYVTMEHLEDGTAWGVAANSGNANACCPMSHEYAEEMARLAARATGRAPADFVVASTGVIGQTLNIAAIRAGMPAAAAGLTAGPEGSDAAARAIMTTDTVKKELALACSIGGRTVTLGAIGTMTASWTYYGAEDNSTVLYGTKGILRIYDDPAYSLKLITAGGEKALYELEAIQTNDNQTASGVIDCFMDCLTGNTPPAISGESVLTAMRAVFACLESSRTGRAVSVAQD